MPDNPGVDRNPPAGTLAVPDSATTDEATALPFLDVLANDRGPANLSVRHVAAVDTTGALGLAAVLPDGSGVSYDPNGAFESLGVGDVATDTFTYTHQRGPNGASQTATVEVTVTGVNDAPVAVDDGGAGFSTDEDTAFTTASVLANDGDPDAGDTLTVSAVNGAAIAVGTPIALASGALLTPNGDGTFRYDPNGAFESVVAGESATDGFTYTVDDGHGGSATATVTVTIEGVDEAPLSINAVVANYRENNQVLRNDGADGFTARDLFEPAASINFSWDVALGDLDGDGDLDAFEAHAGQNNVVRINGSNVSSTATSISIFVPVAYSILETGSRASFGVALGDLDGDGDLDALVANTLGQTNQVFTNDGRGRFTAADIPEKIPRYSFDVALGDLDGDGDLDALVANYVSLNQVFTNDGAGGFTAVTDGGIEGTLGKSYGVALGDLDGDGDLDALVANADTTNQMLINEGSYGGGEGLEFRFVTSSLPGGDWNSRDVALGDLDGDGDLDALVANSGTANQVLINQGGAQGGTEGDFTAADIENTLGKSYGVALGDLDGDGDLDALVANYGAANQVLTNNGLGTGPHRSEINFSVADAPGGTRSTGVALGDLNGYTGGDDNSPVVTASGLPDLGPLVPMPAETAMA